MRERGSNAARQQRKCGGGSPDCVGFGRENETSFYRFVTIASVSVILRRRHHTEASSDTLPKTRHPTEDTTPYRRHDTIPKHRPTPYRRHDTIPKTRHKKSRMPELIQVFGCACRNRSRFGRDSVAIASRKRDFILSFRSQSVAIGHTLAKTRHKKSRMPELIQAFGSACRYASGS